MQANKVTQFLDKAIFQISRIINVVGLVILAMMTLLIVADVTSRYLFNLPITGSFEVTEFMMAILVAFGLAYTAVRKGHINIGLVISPVSDTGSSDYTVAIHPAISKRRNL